jgi:hypothetical protein
MAANEVICYVPLLQPKQLNSPFSSAAGVSATVSLSACNERSQLSDSIWCIAFRLPVNSGITPPRVIAFVAHLLDRRGAQ